MIIIALILEEAFLQYIKRKTSDEIQKEVNVTFQGVQIVQLYFICKLVDAKIAFQIRAISMQRFFLILPEIDINEWQS